MLTVACWKWRPSRGYRSEFGPQTVNVLRRMVARGYPAPHRFVCLTDDPRGLDPDIEALPLWTDFANVPNPWGPRNPSCYRRLKLFAPDIATVLGERVVSMDLDCVVTGDLRPLWDRPEDFIIWGDTNRRTLYNGSMFLLRAGTRPQVWERFDPKTSPGRAKAAGQFGSDQGWIGYVLGKGETRWTQRDGVYSFRNDLKGNGRLPADARIVFFHGHGDPWQPALQRIPWIRRCYQ